MPKKSEKKVYVALKGFNLKELSEIEEAGGKLTRLEQVEGRGDGKILFDAEIYLSNIDEPNASSFRALEWLTTLFKLMGVNDRLESDDS